MKVEIPYGSNVIQIAVPKENIEFVIEPFHYPHVTDVGREVSRSLANPIRSPQVKDLARKAKRVVIVTDDVTRITPVKQILPPLIDELRSAGIRDGNVKVIIALGTHRKMSDDEIRSKFGEEILSSIRVENHECMDKERLVYAQRTRSGYPIWVNKEYAEADLKIGVGNVQPHDTAGWSGVQRFYFPG